MAQAEYSEEMCSEDDSRVISMFIQHTCTCPGDEEYIEEENAVEDSLSEDEERGTNNEALPE